MKPPETPADYERLGRFVREHALELVLLCMTGIAPESKNAARRARLLRQFANAACIDLDYICERSR